MVEFVGRNVIRRSSRLRSDQLEGCRTSRRDAIGARLRREPGRGKRRLVSLLAGGFLLVLGVVTPSPAIAGPPSPQACAGPPSGPGIYAAVKYFNFPQVCGNSTILRQGDTYFGLTHIGSGGSTGNQGNHETTDYAMSIWQAALNQPPLIAPADGYYKHGIYYTTPSGTPRVMCVYVDSKDLDGYGAKGIITTFWVASSYTTECLSEK